MFGSLISSTDPVAVLAIFKELNVDKNLYYLVPILFKLDIWRKRLK